MNNFLKEIALNNLNIFHTKCTRGIYNDKLFKFIINNIRQFNSDDIEWIKEFVNSSNELIASACLEITCTAGTPVSEFNDIIEVNLNRNKWCHKFIDIAEKQNDPESLLFFINENEIYLNRVILALKRMKQETYLTTLLISDNENLSNSVMRIINNEK